MPRLSDDDIRSALTEGLPGWTYDGAAIGFIDRLAVEAHAARHHPDIENHYNRVLVSLSTHDEGGVTELDVALARTIEAVAQPPEA
jgi:4a-hydroxytetrahydrobiopterin dehydratase